MKKRALIFILSIGTIVSCDDSGIRPSGGNQLSDLNKVELKNGMLAFESINDYRSLIENPDDEQKKAFVRQFNEASSYRSLLKAFLSNSTTSSGRRLSEKEIDVASSNDFLATLLNEDGMISIGDYTFRVDLQSEKVFTVDNRNTSAVTDLRKGITSGRSIFTLSTADDVLAIVESGTLEETSAGRANFLCTRESGADAKSDKHEEIVLVTKQDAPNLVMNADMKHVYQKAGIYFSLMLELKYMWKRADCGTIICYSQLPTDISATVTYRYKQKCKSNDTGYVTTTLSVQDDNKLNKRFWESSNALHLYYLDTQFTWNHKGYDPNLPKPGSGDDLTLFLTKLGNRSYHLEPIYDNI